ncbi:MAG: beta-lactamase family protein [Myxococcales bacterium]|nr:beta-lactamase family protein [Myxococcales bacterium]
MSFRDVGRSALLGLLILISPGFCATVHAGLPYAEPARVGMDAEVLTRIDDVMREAISAHETPGGVVLITRRGHIVFAKAYGRRALEPHRERATLDTLYDLASLTKVVATTPAVLRLVEQGRLRLTDRVSVYLPEWRHGVERVGPNKRAEVSARHGCSTEDRNADKNAHGDPEAITLRHLLTHTSGLDDPSTSFFSALGTDRQTDFDRPTVRRQLVAAIFSRPLLFAPGSAFFYSDLNFLLLGEIVERVSGMGLDEFVTRELFEPLSMRDTRFRPPRTWADRIAPTIWTGLQLFKSPRRRARRMLRTEASLQNVAMLSGVAGHAGLFSSAADLAVFCQMLLAGGQHEGTRILSPLSVAAMSRDQAQLASGELRGYGWDIRTSWSTPRGDLFAGGFGHTGWSGGSLWLVPDEQIAIIVLTNRIHPRGRGSSSPLRGKIANVVAASVTAAKSGPARSDDQELSRLAKESSSAVTSSADGAASKPTSNKQAP